MTVMDKLKIQAGCAVLAGTVALLYNHPVFHGFWLYDDPFILKFAINHSPLEYLFVPEIWRIFSSVHFTPAAVVSYGADYLAAGLSAPWFYLHNIISLIMLALVFFFLMKEYISFPFALLSAFFLILSKPFAAASEILMFRHYIEGGIFACASLLLFTLHTRGKGKGFLVSASFLYFLAILCKEIYIPLIMLLVFLPRKDFPARFRAAAFFLPGLAIYFLWRFYMLDHSLAGYSGSLPDAAPSMILPVIIDTLSFFHAALAKTCSSSILYFALIVLFASTGLFFIIKKNLQAVLLMAACISAAIIPVVPIQELLNTQHLINYRFAFGAMLLFCAFAGIAGHILFKALRPLPGLLWPRCFKVLIPGRAFILVLVSLTACHIFSTRIWISQQRHTFTMPLIAEGRFLWEQNRAAALVRTSTIQGIHYYQSLDYLRFMEKGPGKGPVAIASGFGLLSRLQEHFEEQPDFYRYAPETNSMVEVSEKMNSRKNKLINSLNQVPMSVKFDVREGRYDLVLKSGHPEMSFIILMGYRPGIYSNWFQFAPEDRVEFRGSFSAGISGAFRFGIFCPEKGILSLSPEWWVDFSEEVTINWSSLNTGLPQEN